MAEPQNNPWITDLPVQAKRIDQMAYLMIEPKYEAYLQRIDAKLTWLMKEGFPGGVHMNHHIDATHPIPKEEE